MDWAQQRGHIAEEAGSCASEQTALRAGAQINSLRFFFGGQSDQKV
jgi:hypothetical protein